MSRCYTPDPVTFTRYLLSGFCAKCGKPFQPNEPVVNKNQNSKGEAQFRHGAGSKKELRWYHKNCFTDAKGVPIYD